MCLQELIKTIMQDTGIFILTAQSDPKFGTSFPPRENPGCPETIFLLEYQSEVFHYCTTASHMELLSLVQHNILVEGEQTAQGHGCSLFCTLNFPSPAHGHPLLHPLP